jgi:hypothetical protein
MFNGCRVMLVPELVSNNEQVLNECDFHPLCDRSYIGRRISPNGFASPRTPGRSPRMLWATRNRYKIR